MDIDRILVQRGPVLDNFLTVVPAGWQQVEEAEQWVLFERTTPSPAQSPTVSWADPGVTVTTTDGVDRVDAPEGGRLTLSRPWVPGLQVRVGDETIDAAALDAIYPVVDLPPGTSGELRVTYRLPRLRLLIVAVFAGIVLAAVSVVTALRLRRRSVLVVHQADEG